MNIIITIASVLAVLGLLRAFRDPIARWLIRLRGKLQIQSLRFAIEDADKDKAKTGRKNMVVFNKETGKFEPIQKRLLKVASRNSKNKSNKAMTDGRKRMMKQTKKRVFTPEKVKSLEKKSVYVTN